VASISKQPNGRKTIQFVAPDGKRKSIRLGKTSLRAAEAVKLKVEHLVSALNTKHAPDAETSRWLAEISDDLRDKLAAVGLIEKRETATVGQFTQDYISGRVDLKPPTIRHLTEARRDLVDFLGEFRPLSSVTAGDADSFRLFLIEKGLADGTTARRVMGRAKQFFHAAVRHKLIHENPFAGQKVSVQSNPDRFAFVSLEDAMSVLNACPDAEWRLLFALARFARTESSTVTSLRIALSLSRSQPVLTATRLPISLLSSSSLSRNGAHRSWIALQAAVLLTL